MDGVLCRQPGCGGTIEGGFCNRCGLEPPAGTVTMVGPPPGSARSTAASVGSGRTGSAASRRGTGHSSTRKNLGLGMVAVPELPPIDPEKVILADPQVPEHKRFCSNPDCRDANGHPTPLSRRVAGHCPQCGRRYSFVPTLSPGDLVAGQYEVRGCLAYGGLGWVYLARDAVLNRWVVLKGLLNAADEGAAAAAVAERQFLAAVKHPNVVGIYNFVSRGTEGYIVMEYVAGRSVRDLRKERGALPPAEAIAYVHRILGAFAYLHQHGLVYCDFKPDNFMLEGDPPDVKLIDLGGVRRLDDTGGDVYGTRGFTAPEASANPTVASDLYTVGRTLAVLLMDFRYQGTYEFALPPPAEQPVLARHDSLYRFLRRATHPEPDARFQSAEEMADQLAGVLREVVAETGGEPRPADSPIFGGDVLALHHDDHRDEPSATLVPALKLDADDPGAGFLTSIGVLAKPAMRATAIAQGVAKFPDSSELPLRLAEARIATGDYTGTEAQLAAVAEKDPFDWRVGWYRGLAALAERKGDLARARFEEVYNELPGEPAAKLAMALAAEAAGDDAVAAPLYDRVSRTDPAFVTASFGLARCLRRAGRRAEAAVALQRVPATSSAYTAAQVALARALLGSDSALPSAEELSRAADVVQALDLQGAEFHRLRAEVLERALAVLAAKAPGPPGVFGEPFAEAPLRRALEATLRQLARQESDRSRQIELIDRANQVRPVTWV
jgi:serine/threonine-protein kinase PknG